MKKILITSAFLFSLLTLPFLFALDPVAPKSERAFGFLTVESPLATDIIEITSLKNSVDNFKITFNNDEMIKIPIGEYFLRVKMQEVKWSQKIEVLPTELTEITVVGYGNLSVKSPYPDQTTVEVSSKEGKGITTFKASQIKTLPTGTYRVTIKLPPEEFVNIRNVYPDEVTKNDVEIITNQTRRLIVWR